MEQMSFDEIQYKYIIDTSAILEQKPNGSRSRSIYKGLWKRIDDFIKQKRIVICSEIEDEIRDDDIKDLLHRLECVVIPISDSIQHDVIRLVTENKKMISFGNNKGSSSGDAFLIATAVNYNLTVITQENKDNANKIPQICKKYNVDCVDINGLCEREQWSFY